METKGVARKEVNVEEEGKVVQEEHLAPVRVEKMEAILAA